jgi:hypothetical protein
MTRWAVWNGGDLDALLVGLRDLRPDEGGHEATEEEAEQSLQQRSAIDAARHRPR